MEEAEAKKAWQPHAVVVAYPGQGHINPLMQLSLRLASSMGFYVTFVCTRGNHRSILEAWAKRGIPQPLEQGISIHLATIRDDMLPERNMRDMLRFLLATQTMLKEPFVELMEGLVENPFSPPVSCIISDSILGWAQDVADMLHVPWIAYFPLPVSTFLVQLNEGKIPIEEDNLKGDCVLHLPGLPPVHHKDLPFFLQNNPMHPKYEIASTERLRNASWVFVNSCDALEGAEILAAQRQGFKHLVPVGPLQPAGFLQVQARGPSSSDDITGALWGEDHGCLEWLDKQPASSVLYISFGSVSSISLAEMESLLRGLVKADEAFLWVLRPDLVMGMAEDVWKSFVEKANKHGLIVRWAPQLKVLTHPSTGAFLTHCGWNSTFESICAGVPLICWPCFAEQSLNCKYIVDVWEVGLRAKKETGGRLVTEDEIERVVQEMMRGDKGIVMRKKVAELRDACRKAYVESNTLKAFAESLRV